MPPTKAGRDETEKWFKPNVARLGKQSTIDLGAAFLDLGLHLLG